MLEITRRVRTGKFLTFPIDEEVLGMLENRFGVVPSSNRQGVSIRRWKAEVPFVSYLSIMDSMRTS